MTFVRNQSVLMVAESQSIESFYILNVNPRMSLHLYSHLAIVPAFGKSIVLSLKLALNVLCLLDHMSTYL